jgi:hypothetical protein
VVGAAAAFSVVVGGVSLFGVSSFLPARRRVESNTVWSGLIV